MKPIALTCGDPAGVGPEIIRLWLEAPASRRGDVVVLGPPVWLATLPDDVRVHPIGRDDYAPLPGQPDPEGALVAWAAMQVAADGCKAGEFSGVVTGPVSKSRLAAVGYPHPGQTEFFASVWGGEPTMAFCGGRLRVVLATWHVPLRDVPGALTEACLERAVRSADELVRADGGGASGTPDSTAARIAVCGLNPHAGEDGLLGDEEKTQIDPVLDRLRLRHPGLSRTLPGDTAFARSLRGEYDVVVALYHDQGLAPLKTIDFDQAVNVTLGLPFVRTSPDHGTAFDIAGRGEASITSFSTAVDVARKLITWRQSVAKVRS